MSIINITVRTFSSIEHAELFLNIAKANQIPKELSSYNLSADFKIVQNIEQKNQIISIWEYENEIHMKKIRDCLSKFSKLPNSLNPKEIHYTTQVVHSSDKYS